MANQFAAAARARKVRALCVYFDVVFARLDVDPIREADKVVIALRELSEEQWRLHAIVAGQRPPSQETVAEIIAVYEGRTFESENVVASQRFGGMN